MKLCIRAHKIHYVLVILALTGALHARCRGSGKGCFLDFHSAQSFVSSTFCASCVSCVSCAFVSPGTACSDYDDGDGDIDDDDDDDH